MSPQNASQHRARSRALLLLLVAALCAVTVGALEHPAGAASSAPVKNSAGQALTPQPAAAAKEMPPMYADGCGLSGLNNSTAVPKGTNPKARNCRYLPNKGNGDVVLVGDSHAAAWSQTVRTIAADNGWGLTMWARNTCPLADVTKIMSQKPYRVCDTWRRNVMNAIIKMHPSMVITSSMDTTLPPLYLRDKHGNATTKLVGGAAARKMWEAGMVRSLTRLRNAGIKVLMIHDTPGFPQNMPAPDCLTKHRDNLDACSSPQTLARPDAPNDMSAAQQVGGVSTEDFTSVFCRDGRCYEVVGHTIGFRDVGHLTHEMTEALRPQLAMAAQGTMGGLIGNYSALPLLVSA